MYLPFQAVVFRKGKIFGRPGGLVWTAKASPIRGGGIAQQ